MNKKYIIAGVAVILAVWIGFSFGKKAAVAPEAPLNGGIDQATTTPAADTTAITKTITTATAPKTTTGANPAILKDGSYLVSYTATGFSPSILTIKAGKSVRFVNNSNKAMSLTTTDPNSQVFSEFNQEKTVGRGGSYDFTFLKAGSWGYMNRNNQADRGVVIVQ